MPTRTHIDRFRARCATEDGFTLVELLVAMVIGIIALTLVVTTLRDGFKGADRTMQSARADSAAARIIDQFGADMRLAVAPDREGEISPDDLRGAILYGKQVRDWDGNALDVHDIRGVTPNDIAFLADVDRTRAGTECVQWNLRGDGLYRTVKAGTNPESCGGATLQDQKLAEAPPERFADTSVFSYTRLVNTNLSAGNIDRRNCRRETTRDTAFTAQVTNRAGQVTLGQIVNVQIDVRVFFEDGKGGGANGDSTFVSAVNVRNRLNRDYLYALGCSY